MVAAMHGSRSALFALLLFVAIATVLFASAIYAVELLSCPDLVHATFDVDQYLERCATASRFGQNPDGYGLCCTANQTPENFPDIPSAFWWAIVTMTTVGYGDFVPMSIFGRLVGGCCMMCGILVIALPVAVVGAKFQDLYDQHNSNQEDPLKRLHYLSQNQVKLPGLQFLNTDGDESSKSSPGGKSPSKFAPDSDNGRISFAGFHDLVAALTQQSKDSHRLMDTLAGIKLDAKTSRNVQVLVNLFDKKSRLQKHRAGLREQEKVQIEKAEAALLAIIRKLARGGSGSAEGVSATAGDVMSPPQSPFRPPLRPSEPSVHA